MCKELYHNPWNRSICRAAHPLKPSKAVVSIIPQKMLSNDKKTQHCAKTMSNYGLKFAVTHHPPMVSVLAKYEPEGI